jgi:pimeloyl-ACP methyl ester carboxylesterase
MAPGSVVGSVDALPGRYRGDPEGRLRARFRLRIGALVRDVVVEPDSCRVEAPQGYPDAAISTSPATWLELDEGWISGIEAFAAGRLALRGSIQKALLFEPLFDRPDRGALRYEVGRVSVPGAKISALTVGPENADPLLLIHGLGATKASVVPIIPSLARHNRVIAIDLPGFGDSSKPRGRYDAAWFARHTLALLDRLGIDSAAIVGNSMGGRIAQEVAITAPERVLGIACLCPATAFSERPGLPLVRILRPELGLALGRVSRRRILNTLQDLFAQPSRVDDSWFEAAADDFLRTWKSPRARMAFFAAARHIYLEEGYGERGFWSRLRNMEPPALYIFGEDDGLITPRFAAKVSKHLPRAEVQVWRDCGHAPQIEHPDRTAEVLLRFFRRASGGLAAAQQTG